MGLLVLIKPEVILPAEVVLQCGVGKDLLRSEGGRGSTGGNKVDGDGGGRMLPATTHQRPHCGHGRVEGTPVVAVEWLNLEGGGSIVQHDGDQAGLKCTGQGTQEGPRSISTLESLMCTMCKLQQGSRRC
jgi:hypothetical protein